MSKVVDKIIIESQLNDIKEGLASLEAQSPEMEELIEDLLEEVTASDWTRIGTIVGMLWYKFDTVANAIKDGNRTQREVLRVLQDMKRDLTKTRKVR